MLKSVKQPSLYISPRMNHCWITRCNDDVNDEVTCEFTFYACDCLDNHTILDSCENNKKMSFV